MAQIGSVELPSDYMNAACSVAKTFDDIEALCATNAGTVTIGSITVEQRAGNPEPRWYENNDFALNSFGMPNAGHDAYKLQLPQMIETIHASGKIASLSIAGFSVDDYAKLASLANETGIDLLELNLGCPNIQVDGKQKSIASFDIEYMMQIVDAVSKQTAIPLMLKLSPYSNPAELQDVALAIAASNKISGVVASNTFANGYYEKDASPVLGATYGGISGRAMLPIALGQVRQFYQALPDSIAVVGVGGIETAADKELFLSAGAIAVQAATLIVRDEHGALDRLAS